jgi:hypothetical protein
MIVVDALPGGTLDPSVDRSLPLDRQTGEGMGIDATFPFGAEIRTAGARPVSRDICGPALAEKGHEYIEVAEVPGRREYEFAELKGGGCWRRSWELGGERRVPAYFGWLRRRMARERATFTCRHKSTTVDTIK